MTLWIQLTTQLPQQPKHINLNDLYTQKTLEKRINLIPQLGMKQLVKYENCLLFYPMIGLQVLMWGGVSVEMERGRQLLYHLHSYSHQRSRFMLGLCRSLSSQHSPVPRGLATPDIILSIIPWIIAMPLFKMWAPLPYVIHWLVCIHRCKSEVSFMLKRGIEGWDML